MMKEGTIFQIIVLKSENEIQVWSLYICNTFLP